MIYIVCTNDCWGASYEFLKAFKEKKSAIAYAVNKANELSNDIYKEHHIQSILEEENYFVYTQYHDQDYDKQIQIISIEFEE